MSVAGGPDLIQDGLVLCLDAANTKSYPGSGTSWVDLSGNGNNGTLTNGPTFNSANGGSIVFDGANDNVGINYSPSINITGVNITLSCWIRAIALANSNSGAGLIVRGSGQNNAFYEALLLPVNSKNYTFFRMLNVGTYHPALIPIELNLDYNICCVYDGGVMRNYVNGVQEGTGSAIYQNIIGGTNSFQSIRLGNRLHDESALFNGRMSQALLYNRALSASEVLQNYNATKGRFRL